MTAAGWYHADGDAEGTVRYWDGTQWQGEPSSATTSNDIVYYAAVDDQVDLGDVASRITLTNTNPSKVYTESPYTATTGTVNVTRRKALPEGLKNLTILVCVLKALPLLGLVASLLTRLLRRTSVGRTALSGNPPGRFDPPGLDYTSSSATLILIAVFVLFAGLTIGQGRSAINNQASNLFAIALMMVVFDLLNAANQWAQVSRGLSPATSLLATLILILQGLVTVWAGIRVIRS